MGSLELPQRSGFAGTLSRRVSVVRSVVRSAVRFVAAARFAEARSRRLMAANLRAAEVHQPAASVLERN